ncbi:MAG: hypothetical protein AAB152_01420 [Candidatus Coatesbacteria bacterium]
MKGNVLVIRGLKPGSRWCDKDRVLVYACFQLLVDFMEQEKPQTIVDYEHDATQRRQWRELRALYRYWKIERPRDEQAIDRALRRWSARHKTRLVPLPDGTGSRLEVLRTDRKAWQMLNRLERAFARREDRMLRRLIDARHWLWC